MKALRLNKLLKALKFTMLVGFVVLIGIYLCCAPRINSSITYKILFHPPDRSLDHQLKIGGVNGQHYKIKVDNNVVLDSVLYQLPSDREKGVVFFSLGVGGSINCLGDPYKIQALLDSGYSVFMYDHEGYGLSSGKCDIGRIVPDAVAAFDFLVGNLKYRPEKIVVYGESFGGGVTSELLKQRHPRAIIVKSTFISPKRWADDQVSITKIYPQFLFMEPAFDNLAMLRGVHPPALLITCGRDANMPASHARELANGASQPFQHIALPNSGHEGISEADRPKFHAAIEQFLNRQQ